MVVYNNKEDGSQEDGQCWEEVLAFSFGTLLYPFKKTYFHYQL